MDYEQFKKELTEKLKEYLPDKFGDAEINFETAYMNNGQTYNGVIIMSSEESMAPRINIDELYSSWLSGDSIEDIAKEISERRTALDSDLSEKYEKAQALFGDTEKIKEHIVRALVNTDANKESLLRRPHEEIEDVSYVYYIAMNGIGSSSRVSVTYDLMDRFGLKEDELKTLAENNTQKLLPLKVETLFSALDLPIEEDEPEMVVVSNRDGINGAGALLYPDADEKIRQILKADYYILPSSVHEVIAVKKDESRSLWDLRDMVKNVNEMELQPQDILSFNVYEKQGDSLAIAKTPWEKSLERETVRPKARSSEMEI